MELLRNHIYTGNCLQVLRELPDSSVHCCVTSPPYWGLRDYGHPDQLGAEPDYRDFVAKLVEVFTEVHRVLRDDGTLWLNLGDTYVNTGTGGNGATGGRDKSTLQSKMPPVGTTPVKRQVPAGLKVKDLAGIPWRVAFALQEAGWYLRQDIIWHKPNPMPESVTDRCTKAHEYLFLLTKSKQYYYDHRVIMEPAVYGEQHAKKSTSWGTNRKHPNKANVEKYMHTGDNHTCHQDEQGNYMRNRRSVWSVSTRPYAGAHFATFPPDLIEPCILAGCPEDGIVLDPFMGAGTVAVVAYEHRRDYVGIELNPAYVDLATQRLADYKFAHPRHVRL